MADQTSDKTLDSPDDTVTVDSTADDSAGSLSRNSSFSKLNALAPEFVPKKTHPSPPSSLSGDPRVLIVPPPPPPPPSMVRVFSAPPQPPPPQVNSQFPVMPLPHLNHHHLPVHHHDHHPQQQHHHHHRRNHRSEEGVSQGGDKDHGQGSNGVSKNNNGGSKNTNGLSDDNTQKLINQVEYYFSDVNLATTDHLIRFINKDPEGFVPISVVASFKKIKALISSNSQLAAVLRNSTKLVVSEDGKKIKRVHPLTGSDMEELQARIIVAENLPEDHCHQKLMKIFSTVGSVKSIRTCLPQPANNGASAASRPSKSDNMLYCNKLHAFVEYETIELAEKAISELNDERDWRNGLRVRSLLKQGSKTVQARGKKSGNEGDVTCEARGKKAGNEGEIICEAQGKKSGNEGEVTCEEEDASTSEQNQNEKQPSENLSRQSDVQSHDHGEDQSMEKEGGQKKSRNRGRGKGRGRGHHNHHQNNRGNHVGSPPMNNTVNGDHPIVAKQQPPGPRMPDGTRGFSMGRGRPIAVNTTA